MAKQDETSGPECRRRSVLRVYEALSAGGLDGDVLGAVFGPDARHHSSLTVDDGPPGALQLYQALQGRLPGVVATVKRIAADGEYVAVHWHAALDPQDEFSGESWCEVFRFVGDRVAEHWQLHVDAPASTVSGRSVFDDAYAPATDPVEADAAINREIVSSAFARFLDFDPTVVSDHWGEVYLQHNEMIPDGPDSLRESLEEIGALPTERRPAFTVLVTVAEGDLVWFLERVRVGEATGLGVDIFRVRDRRIVEHWDIPALRPD